MLIKRVTLAVGAVFAAIGVLFVIGIIATNTGVVPFCGPPAERAFPSPAGLYAAIVETAQCGESERRISIKVLGKEGSIDHVFIAHSKRADDIVDPRWEAADKLEVRYSETLRVSFPGNTDSLKAVNQFNGLPVRVVYRSE